MRKKLALCLFMILLCAPVATANAVDTCSLMSHAELLFMQRADMHKAQEALNFYRRVLEANPTSEAASLRLCRLLIFIGAQSPASEEEDYYQQAIDVARAATNMHPDRPGPHYWLGMSCALLGGAKSNLSSLQLVAEARQQMQVVLELDPTYDFGGAYRILGRIYTLLPGIVGGDYDKAEQMLGKACQLGPSYLLNHLYLADVYIQTDRPAEAEKVLHQVLSTSVMNGLEPEDKLWKMHASRLLETTSVR